jgi:hypothetical protein
MLRRWSSHIIINQTQEKREGENVAKKGEVSMTSPPDPLSF